MITSGPALIFPPVLVVTPSEEVPMPRISLAILFCLFPTVAWGQPSLLEHGRAALDKKDYDQAIRLFSDLLRLSAYLGAHL
jgi:hypothetical protein